jgi:hypothetical protein
MVTALTPSPAELAASPVVFCKVATGITPHRWQRKLLRSTHPNICICSRQSGKSLSVAVKALHRALYIPEQMVLIVAYTDRQALRLF